MYILQMPLVVILPFKPLRSVGTVDVIALNMPLRRMRLHVPLQIFFEQERLVADAALLRPFAAIVIAGVFVEVRLGVELLSAAGECP